MQSNYDELIKIMLVGDSNVGKTSILNAYCHSNQHAKPLKPTVGLDYGQRIVSIKGRNVLVQMWDTAGQQRFQALTPSFYRSAMGIMLVFSVTDKSSFNSVQLWMRQIRQYAAEGVPVVILCNKIDIPTKQVSDSQCKALQKRHKIRTLNTSVVSNHNIADAVFALYERISQLRRVRPRRNSEAETLSKQQEGVRISAGKKKEEAWCRC